MNAALHGVSVVVTRARAQSAELVELLESAGATAIEFPVITIVSPDDGGLAVARAFEHAATYDWLVITSVNTVDQVGSFARTFRGKVAVIGSGTAAAVTELGLGVDLVPREFVAESLVEAFPSGDGRVLLPQAADARDVVATGLSDKGWSVDAVVAYKKTLRRPSEAEKQRVAVADVVTFTAASTVEAFLVTGAKVPPVVACIGPVTARAAEQNGLTVAVSAYEHSIEGLVRALREFMRWRPEVR